MNEDELKAIIQDCERQLTEYRLAGQVGAYDPAYLDLCTIHEHRFKPRPVSLAAHQDLLGRTGIGEVYKRMIQFKDTLHELEKPDWAKQ